MRSSPSSEDAAADLGGLDVLVNNASGGAGPGEEAWRAGFEVDVMSGVRAVEAALPALSQSEAGSIVFISSTAALEYLGMPQGYNAMKAAVIAHASDLSQALAPRGIRVNVVSPGPIYFEGGNWEMIKQAMPKIYEAALGQCAIGRMGAPEEVGRAVVFLASPAASLITGANLVADGGFTKRVAYLDRAQAPRRSERTACPGRTKNCPCRIPSETRSRRGIPISRSSIATRATFRRCCAGDPPGSFRSSAFPVERYVSQEFHDLEMEKVWGRVWQMACREEVLVEPGDHTVYEIGDRLGRDRSRQRWSDPRLPQRLPAPRAAPEGTAPAAAASFVVRSTAGAGTSTVRRARSPATGTSRTPSARSSGCPR